MKAVALGCAEPRPPPRELDVLIVGAGLSGIGAACRLKTLRPRDSFVVLEARDTIGGTWDLFRYPGVRSDSDMFTLGYPFRPWAEARTIADGASILAYIRETATELGIDPHIRFRRRIVRGSWSTSEQRWTVEAEVRATEHPPALAASGVAREPVRETYCCRFLYLCSGYYRYDAAHAPTFEGADTFRGRVVHPQWWPEDLDVADKRVVIIGSGATAVTLVPALARSAAHVTMLQRSPSYVASIPAEDPLADTIRRFLPASVSHRVLRAKNALLALALYQFCRRFPRAASRFLRSRVAARLPAGFAMETHFTPRYQPWDQRLCLVPNGDLFKPIRSGKAEVVTDTVATFTETGLRLSSGREIEADVVITATGLEILALGGIELTIDGHILEPKNALVYKGLMLSEVPNLAWCVGYTNASWTLRADLSSRYVCRLLGYMERHRYGVAVARSTEAADETHGLLDLSSGYVQRAAAKLPRQGDRAPWCLRQNYVLDYVSMRLGRVDDPAMHFTRRREPESERLGSAPGSRLASP